MKIFVTYSDDNQIKRLDNSSLFKFIDMSTSKGRKEGYALKSHWAARLDPFIIIMDEDKPVKAFYSEADSDVVGSLLTYLKNA